MVSVRGRTIVYIKKVSLAVDCSEHRKTSEDDTADPQGRDEGGLDEGDSSEDDDSGQMTDVL